MPLTLEIEPEVTGEPPSGGPLLTIKDLRISFVTRTGKIQALDRVSLEVKKGETLGLVGETGCGKSQTALAVMRLTPEMGVVENGEIWFRSQNLLQNAKNESSIQVRRGRIRIRRDKRALRNMNAQMSKIRGNRISMIFQEPMTSLNPVYTIGRQISETLLIHRISELTERVLARNSARAKSLRELAQRLTEGITRSNLQDVLSQYGLEGIEDEVWSVLSDSKVEKSKKIAKIEALSQKMTVRVNTRFLQSIKRNNGVVPRRYRALDRVPIVRRRITGALRQEAEAISLGLLRQVGMPNPEKVLRQYPHELSGGMRQRIIIAIAIATRPDLIIADEPTSALDVTVQAEVLDLLRELKKDLKTSVLFISHDLGVIAEVCDRVAVMYAGNVVEVAEVQELFSNPKHPYTKGLKAAIPTFGEKRDTLEVIPGIVPNLANPPKGCRFASRCAYAFDKCTEAPPWVVLGKGHGVLCWLYEGEDKTE